MRPEITLGFDTSAAHCAAALLLPDGSAVNTLESMEKGQAERLMPLLQDLLAQAGIGWHDLTMIGVGTGPGNFTGVRISVAAARGLALGLGIPAQGVTRLEALAHGLPRPLLVAEDARRGEAYVQGFGLQTLETACLMPVDALPAAPYVTGSALSDGLPPALPLAEAIARIAASRPARARPAPFYLRGADAAPPADPPPVILP
ncbi:MAG: tRNA (adenosine(37)-N6)-threonylcarbamoyltransferase complex dimerization subunit type 1 TsaB [Rhodobacteraceae bacterium GWE1_64_9]|nr:MAG: tRNA (adenosine(37)-N6)-threonylcarbamoyltransferase complex dimerization subunit type 1 TsaB [Rhodobacteraceae bacterium GWE1_64_9]OHC50061.1 MAG: tRNA (adenosine(37)-N6)-threonylcarbamoyltransferase complex dimerization subunit type 1 TsaB [Rhodobacteraceae bacterium GWF1_65_7]HBD92202.1 tRNA (adenosine(37)-N6)-threonylcarbamoyltransferase complex dimerization subunit type 1 TsaB [Gemmobacter sp.]HBU15061.1 tRNA (adenosine(37)-N6)-threonylcarbamoyltransferase complex dimerization subun